MSTFSAQRGSMLLECLVGISIFSFGVLAIMALQGNAMRHVSNSSSRTAATQLIQRLDGEMRVGVADLDDFKLSRVKCANVDKGSASKLWASAVAANLDDSSCAVSIEANSNTPCSRRALISISWPAQRNSKSTKIAGANQSLNEAISIADIQTIRETNDTHDTSHLRCGK
ncbi:hypothetical protein [Iodobacter sp.]|uniref:type IV pilus modification PilV family protein n=1 Tax=Iodobacter sp. TaxID=1915058 RepID=UPI0025E80A0D|nr:hypothetical protein [Iodobacter sp.]